MHMPENTSSTGQGHAATAESLVTTDDDLRTLSAEKLRHEIDKLQRERDSSLKDSLQRPPIWRSVAPFLTTLTPLIAIVSLAMGWWTESSKREYERFYTQMSLLTSEGQDAKQKSALITLTPFWKSVKYRTELRRVVLEQMLTDRSDEVRRLMLAELLRDTIAVDAELLALIGERNRDIARQYRLRVGSDKFHSAVLLPVGMPFLEAFQADSSLHHTAHSLVWAVRALVRAVNLYRGDVPAVDLDGVMLSIPVWRLDVEDSVLANEDDERLRSGVSFRGTRLRGATMAAIRLRNATLTNVTLDSALLGGTVFDTVRVQGTTSARNLDTRLKVAVLPADASAPSFVSTKNLAVMLRGSQIEATDLFMNSLSRLELDGSSILLTRSTTTSCTGQSSATTCPDDHLLVHRPPNGRELSMRLPQEIR
jgi:uncharacterized protein YjbI with pentapeptide repeats